ncbi:MAG: ATP-binding protein [Bacteroidota bacterium]
MRRIFHWLSCLYFLTLPLVVQGQNLVYSTYDITVADGLMSNRVSDVYQDADGFVWLRTLDGVGRYDGHSFRWFTKSNTPLRGTPRTNKIVEDANGYFWFTDGLHVDLLNRHTLEVVALEDKFSDNLPFELPIRNIWKAPKGGVFIKIDEEGTIYHYHPKTGFRYLHYLQGAATIDCDEVHTWAYYGDCTWAKFNVETDERLKTVSNMYRAQLIADYRPGEDWFAFLHTELLTVKILKAHDGGTEEVFSFQVEEEPPDYKMLVLHNPVTDQLILNGLYQDQTLSQIDLENNQIVPIKNFTPMNTAVFHRLLHIDKNGIYWQQAKHGLRLIKISPSVFTHYARENPARGIWANDSILIIQHHFVELDKPNERKVIPDLPPSQSTLNIETEELWVGNARGIYQLNPQDLRILNHFPAEESHSTWSILRDKERRWWAGYYDGGLGVKQVQDSIIRPFNKTEGYDKFKTGPILQLLEDGSYIWAATKSGLYLIHKKNGIEKRYGTEAEPDQYLPFSDIHFLHKDQDGVYWAATNADGLIRFEIDEEYRVQKFKKYTTEQNLSSDVLYAILEDDRNRLWISSLYGINCFYKDTEVVEVFSDADGLPKMEFNRISHFQDKSGRIFFGTPRGVVGFYPQDIPLQTPYNSPLYASELSIYQASSKKIVNLTRDSIQEIILQPDDRFVRISLSMVDYFNADRQQYSYRIKGLFDEYRTISGNVIEISGLPYGSYTLEVRGQSEDKRFTQQELTIPIVALSPIYLRWWFLTILIVSFLLFVAWSYQWRIRQVEQRRISLQRLVDERTAQLARQAEELKTLDKIKSRFFANISHELRTPLTLLIAPVDQLLKEQGLSNRAFTFLKLMRQNGLQLKKRIDELLDLSRLDADRLEIKSEPTALYPFCKTFLASFESAAQLKNIQLLFDFNLPESIQIMVDRDKLEKIIANFLSNALKFTPGGGYIHCRMGRTGNRLQLSVQDTGVGILKEDLPKIFDRFYQSERTSQHEGTGIGLALCRELATAMGGKVWAISDPEGIQGPTGSTFFLDLPLVESFSVTQRNIPVPVPKVDAITSMEEASASLPILQASVLIVEDNPDLQQYTQMILDTDYQVSTASNGQEALDILQGSEKPDLIVADVMMPVMDGMELLAAVKNSDQLQHIPMILLTAQQSMEVKIEALRIGVDDYLTKPFQAVELKARVDNLMRNSQQRLQRSTINHPTKPNLQTIDLEWLKMLESIILENLTTKGYKLSEAAEAMNISYRRLQQKLKGLTGLSPKQYQTSIRLSRAREVLKNGQVQTAQEAMYQIGFDNYYHFSKLYLEAYGLSPFQELQ